MHKILILFALCCSPLYAQQSIQQLDSIVSYTGDNTRFGKTAYTYDVHGNLTSEVETDLYGYGFRIDYTYDRQGHMISEVTSRLVDGQWSTSYKYAYDYDACGNQILLVKYDWMNGQWCFECKTEYTYDSLGI